MAPASSFKNIFYFLTILLLLFPGQIAFGHVDDDSDPLDRGVGFGFTGSVLVNQARANTIGSPGRFGWGGAAGTFFSVEPQEEMVVLFFTQLMVPPYKLPKRLDALVNQAIVE